MRNKIILTISLVIILLIFNTKESNAGFWLGYMLGSSAGESEEIKSKQPTVIYPKNVKGLLLCNLDEDGDCVSYETNPGCSGPTRIKLPPILYLKSKRPSSEFLGIDPTGDGTIFILYGE